MEITRTAKPVKNMADLNVWHCPGCGVVHMSIGKHIVNFSREEFARFTDSVVDIQCSAWTRTGSDHSIIDLVPDVRDGEMSAISSVH